MLTATELRDRLRQGEKDALFAMMTSYYNDLFRYGIKFTADKDLTKDIIGQFFLHIWDNRGKFSAADNVKAYLIVSFKRFMIGYLRKISQQLPVAASEHLFEYPYEECLIAFQQTEKVKLLLGSIIQTLPVRQKQLVELRYYEQLSFEEISRRTSLSVRTVYNKIHEALKKIRAHRLSENLRKISQ